MAPLPVVAANLPPAWPVVPLGLYLIVQLPSALQLELDGLSPFLSPVVVALPPIFPFPCAVALLSLVEVALSLIVPELPSLPEGVLFLAV